MNNKCFKFRDEFPKLTKANSLMCDGRVVVILSKLPDGSDCKTKSINSKGKLVDKTAYVAYDYETKIQLAYHYSKDELKAYMLTVDMDELDVDTIEVIEFTKASKKETEEVDDNYPTMEWCQNMHKEYLRELNAMDV